MSSGTEQFELSGKASDFNVRKLFFFLKLDWVSYYSSFLQSQQENVLPPKLRTRLLCGMCSRSKIINKSVLNGLYYKWLQVLENRELKIILRHDVK